mmetsp:Transcript_6757/g.11748  ORF Transcript_6757/g.11748 Transcript_6757/m.11748 type:complete len:95 (-) Transcript_6757:925-1209(-)
MDMGDARGPKKKTNKKADTKKIKNRENLKAIATRNHHGIQFQGIVPCGVERYKTADRLRKHNGSSHIRMPRHAVTSHGRWIICHFITGSIGSGT